jgi:PAS domain S-box-containing protein
MVQMSPSGIDANESVTHRSSGALPLNYLQRCGLAVVSIGVALGISLLLQHFHFRVPSALLLLFAVAISSWYGGRGAAVLAGILSTISFYWYFVEPVRTIYIYRSEIAYFIIFTAFVALLSWFGTVRRRGEAALREQAALLNLTHDTVFVMDLEGVIKYWNRGAEERYGWTADQAVGRVVHDLLKTVFPVPLDEIKAEVTRTGRWEGELLHTKKDGSQLVAASRWSLERGKQGEPVAILETNNDITERKHAEETLRRLNRELRAISNCNQTLLRATDERRLLEEICRIVCEDAGYRMAWVGYAERDEAKSVRPVAWTGAEEGYLTSAGITWADTDRGCGPTGETIRSGKGCCVQDFATDPRMAPWRESLLQRGFRSGIALPLKDENDKAFGSLTIHSAQPNAFTSEEIRLLEELAGDMAFGIVTLRSRAARERARQEVVLLSFALDKIREGAFLIDDSGRFRYVNEDGCRVLGYTREELLGMGVADIDPEFPAGRWSDHWRDLKAQRSLNFESRHRARDGRIFPVEISANYFEYGGRAYNLGLVRDITDRKRAEEALRRSEAYLAEAERINHAGSWAWSPATRQSLYWSEEMFRIFGLNPQEGVPTTETFWQRIHPEDLDRTYELLAKAALGNMEYEHDHRIVLPDGTVKHIHAIGHPVLGENGQVAEYFGTATDVTERKRAEEALRQSEAYLAEAQRLSHTGSWALDASTREYSYWSDEMFRIFGADPHAGIPIRETMGRRIHPEDASRATAGFEKSLREKVDTSDEYRFVLPDGTVKHIQSIRHPVLNDAGDVVQLVGTFVDITERKAAEEALRESEMRFRTFVDHAADALLVYDLEQRTVVDVNRSACESLGYTRQELIGKTQLDFHLNSYQAEVESVIERAAAGETVFDRHWHRRKDGSAFPVEVHTSLVSYGGRRFLLKVARDISDRVQAEEQRDRLRQLEADLAHIDRVSILGELAASIAHEVNQPLSGIVSSGSACLRWLARDVPDLEEARDAARRIVRDGKRAGEIIARIRALTKKAVASTEKLNLNETIRQVLALVGDEAKRNTVVIQTRFGDEVFPVLGDQVQLQQVVLNLAMNAIEAMSKVSDRPRELVITTRNIDPDQVQVTVEDSGMGIDPQMIDKIFDSFYTTKAGGMGMGLSISRSILQAHGGRLWATSKTGLGTVFRFTLPKYQEDESNAGVRAV